ncbi:hypothetical protein V6N13_109837 [Hibiscus sabdariffa]
MNAVDLANNRRMDSFTIKVFWIGKIQRWLKLIYSEKPQKDVTPKRAILAKGKDSRTYKEALLSKMRPSTEDVIDGTKHGNSETCG